MKALLNQLFAALCSPTILKMVSFAMIGVANALVDFGVFAFAYKLLGMPLVPSNVVAWLVAVSGSYVMNTLITFRHESGRILRRLLAPGTPGVCATSRADARCFVEVLFQKLWFPSSVLPTDSHVASSSSSEASIDKISQIAKPNGQDLKFWPASEFFADDFLWVLSYV